MVDLDTNTDLELWFKLDKQLKALKKQELALRKKVFKLYFPSPSEGTNNADLPFDYSLKGKYSFSRSLDFGAFDSSREEIAGNGILPDVIVVMKPSLSLRDYKKLTDVQRNYFDQYLTIKESTPSLEIVVKKVKES